MCFVLLSYFTLCYVRVSFTKMYFNFCIFDHLIKHLNLRVINEIILLLEWKWSFKKCTQEQDTLLMLWLFKVIQGSIRDQYIEIVHVFLSLLTNYKRDCNVLYYKST